MDIVYIVKHGYKELPGPALKQFIISKLYFTAKHNYSEPLASGKTVRYNQTPSYPIKVSLSPIEECISLRNNREIIVSMFIMSLFQCTVTFHF